MTIEVIGMEWKIQVDGHTSVIEVFEDKVPNTVKAISSILPLKIDLHYAKIAGQEVYGMIPLILPLENKKIVGNFESGTVAYYPDMQMFCLFHGKVQPEEAFASVIGKLHPDPALFEILESVKHRSSVDLFLSDSGKFSPCYQKKFPLLGGVWDHFWEKPIDEIADLKNRKGQSMPSGPIILSWGSVISLRGFLWKIYQLYSKTGYFDEESFMAISEHAQEVLDGWYGLKETAKAVNVFSKAICSNNQVSADLEEMILFAGRLNMWIDSLIPWEEINDVFINKYQQEPV